MSDAEKLASRTATASTLKSRILNLNKVGVRCVLSLGMQTSDGPGTRVSGLGSDVVKIEQGFYV